MSRPAPEKRPASRPTPALALLLIITSVACARTDDEWREDLDSSDPFVRGMAALGLGIQSPREAGAAVPELLQTIDGVDVGLEHEAAEVLVHVAPFHTQLLLDHLVDEDLMSVEKRRAILRALVAAGPTATGPIVMTLRGRGSRLVGDLGEVLLAIGEPAVPDIVALLEEAEDVRLRNFAAFLLAKMGPRAKSAVPALRAATSSADPDLRRMAGEALALIEGRPPQVPVPEESKR